MARAVEKECMNNAKGDVVDEVVVIETENSHNYKN